MGAAEDPYARVSYRRLIAWERRITRESPFLLELLAEAPERSVLDLGCGTGEHVAFFAREGVRAVGLDASESMIDAARDHERAGHGTFVLGDALAAPEALREEPPFGLAICLGNMLPHLVEEEDLQRFLDAAAAVLLPDGLLLVQLLEYGHILEQGIRHLPLNFQEGEEGEEIVFLRLMRPLDGGRMLFLPTTLSVRAGAEEPVSVRASRSVTLRAWTAQDLAPHLAHRGWSVRLLGDMQGGALVPGSSKDLVIVARRPG